MRVSIGRALELTQLPRREEIGAYDWFDIEFSGTQVGKARCRLEADRLTIFSIMIYPEFERRGFARAVIDHFKEESDYIIADRVRCTAREFWLKLGFVAEGKDCFAWRRSRIDWAKKSN
jgi:GNAT superfamily N-acetyltransferase